MVYRETFLQIHKRLLRQLMMECSFLELISLSRETRNRQMVIETTTDLEPK